MKTISGIIMGLCLAIMVGFGWKLASSMTEETLMLMTLVFALVIMSIVFFTACIIMIALILRVPRTDRYTRIERHDRAVLALPSREAGGLIQSNRRQRSALPR